MTTIIDQLVVEFALDPAGNFKKAADEAQTAFKRTKDEVKKSSDQIEHSMKEVGETLRRFRDQLIGIFAVFTAGKGLKEFITDTTQTDATLGRLAKTIGTNVETISTWGQASRQFGGSLTDTANTMKGLTSQFEEWNVTGTSSIVPYLYALQVGFNKTANGALDLNRLLLDLAGARDRLKDDTRSAYLFRSMGLDEGTVNLLLKGKTAVQGYLEEQRRLGVITEANYQAAQKLETAWANLENTARKIGDTLLTAMGPSLQYVTGVLQSFADFAETHMALVTVVFDALTVAVLALSAAITVSLVSGALSQMVVGFQLVIAALAFFLTPVGLAIAAVAALGVAAYELYQHWSDFAKFWTDLWKTVVQDVTNAVSTIKSLWGSLTGEKGAGKSLTTLTVPRPGAKGTTAKPGGGSDVEKLIGMGWTRAQAEGIVANLKRESGGNANATGDSGKAYGLAQWHPDRQAAFLKFAGHDIRKSTRDEQLAFINHELRTTESSAGRVLAQASDASSAAAIVSRLYERPRNADSEAAIRALLANGAASSVGLGASSSSTATTTIGSIIVNTKATDAEGIARDIKPALERSTFAQQSNYGPN